MYSPNYLKEWRESERQSGLIFIFFGILFLALFVFDFEGLYLSLLIALFVGFILGSEWGDRRGRKEKEAETIDHFRYLQSLKKRKESERKN